MTHEVEDSLEADLLAMGFGPGVRPRPCLVVAEGSVVADAIPSGADLLLARILVATEQDWPEGDGNE